MPSFADYFSSSASGYAIYRPSYPSALLEWLAAAAPARDRSWDCGCGSGQASVGLAARFESVVATDPSVEQLRRALSHPGVQYLAATAESPPLRNGSVSLVTAAQALHWFDLGRFYAAVRRVLVPGGVLAVWSYGLVRCAPAVDAVLDRFHGEVVGPYWPPERRLVDSGLADLAFPFAELEPPPLRMQASWSLDHLVGYIGTWSAVSRYRRARGADPVRPLRRELAAVWGTPTAEREVEWPLSLRAGVADGGAEDLSRNGPPAGPGAGGRGEFRD